MPSLDEFATWDFTPAIDLLKTLSFSRRHVDASPTPTYLPGQSHKSGLLAALNETPAADNGRALGDFSRVWEFLSLPQDGGVRIEQHPVHLLETACEPAGKEVRWRDEVSGADLEDNADVEYTASATSERTRKRAERRSRTRRRTGIPASAIQTSLLREGAAESDTGNDSGQELNRLRSSPVRRAVIQDMLRQPSTNAGEPLSPPTSPSPPQEKLLASRREAPAADPSHWVTTAARASSPFPSSSLYQLRPSDNLSPSQRKSRLISQLRKNFPADAKCLKNERLIHPEFVPLNTSTSGIHVFVDISNIAIGFHDCLKRSRNIPISTRIRRVPMSFHNFSLVMERGRPAAKRVLVGSDKYPLIEQAKRIGYETNILERVHKRKELTPRQMKFRSDEATLGLSSGSESQSTRPRETWVEQAVDEVLHLKILESIIDAEKPSRMVLATGDGQEAEYSGGFLRMVERALLKGWMVEVVSFKSNTSGVYKRKDFRSKWGPKFTYVQLDEFVEDLMDAEDE